MPGVDRPLLSAQVEAIVDIGTVEIRRSQRALWRDGGLMREWKQRFPELFDEEDVRVAETQPSLHFVEWLAAIVLHHATGFRALFEKYAYANHPRKQEIVAKLLPADLVPMLREQYGHAQAPDLLMYAPDLSDWFFCEVKGPGDSLRPVQVKKFEDLARVSGKPVRLLHLRWQSEPGRTAAGQTMPP